MGILINYMGRIIAQCRPILNQHNIHFKYLTILLSTIYPNKAEKNKYFLKVKLCNQSWLICFKHHIHLQQQFQSSLINSAFIPISRNSQSPMSPGPPFYLPVPIPWKLFLCLHYPRLMKNSVSSPLFTRNPLPQISCWVRWIWPDNISERARWGPPTWRSTSSLFPYLLPCSPLLSRLNPRSSKFASFF